MNRRYLLVVCAGLAAIGGAYLLGRANGPGPSPTLQAQAEATAATGNWPAVKAPSSSARPARTGAPLPAAGAPLDETFAQLQARANAGDARAAARLARDLGRCHRLRGSASKDAATIDAFTRREVEGMNADQLRTYQHLLDAMELRQAAIGRDQALCAGVDDEMLATLVDSIAQAAMLGDDEARACYLDRGPLLDTRRLLDRPESLGAYRSQVPRLIEAGLGSGDWRVVDLLRRAYEPGAQGLLAGFVGADPVLHYRYLKLYRLAAEPHRVARLDRELASAVVGLTRAQVAEADEWAQRTLRNHFAGRSTGATPPGWETCAF
ncbi:hypothetical protein [Luteimonas sp. R10]|uniref:hypothetical protein n=1 Tax=Luteimonas sp. R10 TaxID=3108176 RepID=UPI00308A26D1|nr:hypothetical protein U3649_05660 [Luteimonas sp. R10]